MACNQPGSQTTGKFSSRSQIQMSKNRTRAPMAQICKIFHDLPLERAASLHVEDGDTQLPPDPANMANEGSYSPTTYRGHRFPSLLYVYLLILKWGTCCSLDSVELQLSLALTTQPWSWMVGFVIL